MDRAGIGMPRGATGGTSGAPLNSGGRNGVAARVGAGAGSSSFFGISAALGAGSGVSATGSGAERRTGGAGGAATAAGFSCGGGTSAASGSDSSGRGFGVAPPLWKCRRTASNCSSSSELEWVFFSWMPNSGSRSRMTDVLTSSSRASSLIRILLITRIAAAHRGSRLIGCHSPFSASPAPGLCGGS